MSALDDCYTSRQLAHVIESAAQAESETLALMSTADIEAARAFHRGYCSALRTIAVAVGLKPHLPEPAGRVAVILATSR
jgi:hypothetical protein